MGFCNYSFLDFYFFYVGISVRPLIVSCRKKVFCRLQGYQSLIMTNDGEINNLEDLVSDLNGEQERSLFHTMLQRKL